jgi:uncharacterized protein (UPF0335 family)
MARRKASPPDGAGASDSINVGSNSAEVLRYAVEQIEHNQREQRDLGQDNAEILKSLKAAGFDMTAVREMMRERKRVQSLGEMRVEQIDIAVDTYRRAYETAAKAKTGS